ncbi:hypothetical protein BGW38_001823 [Lunasporangiospora selenospora]|uniref:Uncharacterized protein n=1 Tax=Lunasporangiospora selenospora TaxID=979761 RepID=A0A9P6G304_9FUNG|nr:hypothetical protein BGW38_001823 [Lunasporangiospora selenospora]
MDVSTLATAFQEWVNTFDCISRPCRHISDLNDGIILFEVAADIDPKWFKLIRSADMGDNWVHKYNNLKKLHKLITRYLEEKLGQSLSRLDPANLNAIAKDGDVVEVLKLCELVIAVAVQCERNQQYIGKIQTLPQASQHALMLSLEQVIEALNSGSTRDSDTEDINMDQELAQLHQERDDLERGNHALLSDLSAMNRKYEAELLSKAEEAVRLKDKLDEYKHAIDRLQKTENVIEKYKKKLEEGADLRRQMKSIEEQNQELLQRNREVEEEYRKVLAFRSLMDSYKEQILSLETKNSLLAKEKHSIEYEARQRIEQLHKLEEEKSQDVEQIQLLEEKVRELEFSGGIPLSDDMQGVESDDIEGAFMGQQTSYTTDLKLQISKLEREIQTLKDDSQEDGGSRVTVLQHLLDDANRLKSKYEQDYLEEHQSKLVLQSELDRTRAGKGDESEAAFTLRTTLNATEKELSSTKKAFAELEISLEQAKNDLTIAQSDLHLAGGNGQQGSEEPALQDSPELATLQEEHARLLEKMKSLEDENKKYLTQLNQVLTEKDSLSKLGLEQKDQQIGEAEAAHTREQLETKNKFLEQQIEQIKEQKDDVNVKLTRAKELIRYQDSVIKEKALPSNSDSFGEAIMSLKVELAAREGEVESLKKTLRETQYQTRREQQLLSSAWNDQIKRGLRENVISQHQRLAPTSWLGVQRRVFNAQLGVRA